MPASKRPLPNWRDPLSETEVGRRVWAFRIALEKGPRQIKRREFLVLADVGNTTLDEIETGKTKEPKRETLRRIAAALDVPLNDILYGRQQNPVEANADVGRDEVLNQLAEATTLWLTRRSPEVRRKIADLCARYAQATGATTVEE